MKRRFDWFSDVRPWHASYFFDKSLDLKNHATLVRWYPISNAKMNGRLVILRSIHAAS